MTIKKKPQESQVEMTEMVQPQHTNALGSVFGGVVLSWVDTAAAICAQKHSEKKVVTASFDAMQFLAPIPLGWIVNIKASVNFVARSSCEVGVRITAENPLTGEFHHTASAYVTMVALDSHGKSIAMPKVEPETEEEKIRFENAQERRKARLDLKEKFLSKKKS